MAVSKKKKNLLVVVIGFIALFLIRPIRAQYKDSTGNIGYGKDVIKTGLFSVKLSNGAVGTIGFLGTKIVWDGGAVWTAV